MLYPQYFSQQILSDWLLLAVIDGQKKQFKWGIQIRTSINLTSRICCENIINVGFPKKRKKKGKRNTYKIS